MKRWQRPVSAQEVRPGSGADQQPLLLSALKSTHLELNKYLRALIGGDLQLAAKLASQGRNQLIAE